MNDHWPNLIFVLDCTGSKNFSSVENRRGMWLPANGNKMISVTSGNAQPEAKRPVHVSQWQQCWSSPTLWQPCPSLSSLARSTHRSYSLLQLPYLFCKIKAISGKFAFCFCSGSVLCEIVHKQVLTGWPIPPDLCFAVSCKFERQK